MIRGIAFGLAVVLLAPDDAPDLAWPITPDGLDDAPTTQTGNVGVADWRLQTIDSDAALPLRPFSFYTAQKE